MSSIISHIYISNILKEKYNLNNEFLYGAMLPDVLTVAVNFKTKNTNTLFATWYIKWK